MSLRFKAAFWVIAAAQLALLVVLIGLKEYTLEAGTVVVLQTVPVDPRSLLQGDYVVLRYKISFLPPHLQNLPVGATVYVTLAEGQGVWEAADYYTGRPESGTLFIKGAVASNGLADFGIGTYFVPEGAGHLVERARDVKVRVSVLDRGDAVIKEVLLDGKPFNPKGSIAPDRQGPRGPEPALPPDHPPPPPGAGFYRGGMVLVIHTEASDPQVASMLTQMMGQGVVLVPRLALAPQWLLADVYVFTNGVNGRGPFGFQADIVDSVPGDPGYSPLRAVNLVTWDPGATARELRSLEEVKAAESTGEVTITRPGAVVNMPMLIWPGGGR